MAKAMMDKKSGIQVLISSYNCAQYLQGCLSSVERALDGYKWMMIFCDDASTDNTQKIIQEYSKKSSADKIVFKSFEKSSIIGEAKNRSCRLSLDYKEDYPVICFMDADDIMGEEKISGLLPHLSSDVPFVFGDYILYAFIKDEWKQTHYVDPKISEPNLIFGTWAVLMLADLIPNNGKFFREDIETYEDILTWWEMKHAKNINITSVPGPVVHHHRVRRSGSCSDRLGEVALKKLGQMKDKIHPVQKQDE